ncbi:MAG: peptide deformylase [Candidatus Freyarchaeota archaeon]|nr:peptide deformylase [Candidatus Jordarchaeia archaeon]MBS7267228.1 peptide deformylase [Candidatus Jordarchaeia archaeon]MBS7278447.1 peptide deformylase [Candidatus Jordarchaeia archaeon]
MPVREVLLLGNPKLYEVSEEIREEELEELKPVIEDLHDTLVDFRKRYGAGRAIAAPQIGVMKRLIYMYITEPVVFINPRLEFETDEMMEIWDDCMCFPDLLVKVKRYRRCRIHYRDMNWKEKSLELEGSLSELLQHEHDHLEGILAVSRAVDGKSFCLTSQRRFITQVATQNPKR